MRKLIIPSDGYTATAYDPETDTVNTIEPTRTLIDELWIVPHDCTVVFGDVKIDVEAGSIVIRTYRMYASNEKEIVILDKDENAAKYFARVNAEYLERRKKEAEGRSVACKDCDDCNDCSLPSPEA